MLLKPPIDLEPRLFCVIDDKGAEIPAFHFYAISLVSKITGASAARGFIYSCSHIVYDVLVRSRSKKHEPLDRHNTIARQRVRLHHILY